MKRQRSNVDCNNNNKGTKKEGEKSKKCLKAVDHQTIMKAEEAKTGGLQAYDAALKESFAGWEDWPWLGIGEVVDEQMSWGSNWMPFWDVEAYSRMYGNLVWDDDIWNLKTLTTVPNL